METDCYPKFLRSSEYSTIMQKRNHQLFSPTSSQSSKNVTDVSSPQMPKSSSRSLQSTLSPPISKQKKSRGLRIKLDKKAMSPPVSSVKSARFQTAYGTAKRSSFSNNNLVVSPDRNSKMLPPTSHSQANQGARSPIPNGGNLNQNKKVLQFFGEEVKENLPNLEGPTVYSPSQTFSKLKITHN